MKILELTLFSDRGKVDYAHRLTKEVGSGFYSVCNRQRWGSGKSSDAGDFAENPSSDLRRGVGLRDRRKGHRTPQSWDRLDARNDSRTLHRRRVQRRGGAEKELGKVG